MSTGSPLSAEAFEFIYRDVSPSLQLCSISGGTDLTSCFVLGTPTQPVHAGEIQSRGLGMAVEILDDDGKPVCGEQGELCCRSRSCRCRSCSGTTSMTRNTAPLYFEHFEGIWRHGDGRP